MFFECLFWDLKKQHHLERKSHAFVAQVVVWNLGKLASQARAELRYPLLLDHPIDSWTFMNERVLQKYQTSG